MDTIIQSDIDNLIINLRKYGDRIEDPVAKLMITALVSQSQKIKDEIAEIPDRVLDRICSYFIPKNKIDAMPALCYVQPVLKDRKGIEPHTLSDGTFFSFKIDAKQHLSFYPLFRNNIIPLTRIHILTSKFLFSRGSRIDLDLSKKGSVWIGMEIPIEIESLQNFSLYIRGTDGVLPKAIYSDNGMAELAFAPASHISEIPMPEPFDSQQISPMTVEIMSSWKNILSNSENGCLIYLTDPLKDRDVFKYKAFPKRFQQLLESSDLDKFEKNTLWLLLDFGEEYDIPSNLDIIPNVLPVVNVDVNYVTLTQSSPIAKLTKDDGSYFLYVMETSLSSQKQGFNSIEEDIVIRDFDSTCYNPDVLHRDVRRLYSHFVDDYHAFVEYHGLKDGELIRSLRELVNKIGKSVGMTSDLKNRFNKGIYAMRNLAMIGQSSSVKVSYLSTKGRLGNSARAGEVMENRKDAVVEKDLNIVESATGGEDKASEDQRYEMLRYYTLTSDRLFTKMDIDAFLRMQLLREFGKDEIKRISYKITIEGAGNRDKLTRGLYIHIFFKDNKNFQKAQSIALNRKLKQQIIDKSCISLPINIELINEGSI